MGGYKEVTIEPRFRRKYGKQLNIRKPQELKQSAKPPYIPGTYIELAWRESETKRVTLTKIQTDGYSRGNIHVTYEKYNTLYVHVDFFMFSVGSWNVGDELGLSRAEEYSKGAFAYENEVREISIVATHVAEEWVYYDDITFEEVDRCYLVYWDDFQPTTLDIADGEEAAVDYYVIATTTGEGFGSTMYAWGSTAGTVEFLSVDVGWFIDYLAAIGRMTNPAAVIPTLIVNMQLEAQYTSGFIVTVSIYGEEGLTFSIERRTLRGRISMATIIRPCTGRFTRFSKLSPITSSYNVGLRGRVEL